VPAAPSLSRYGPLAAHEQPTGVAPCRPALCVASKIGAGPETWECQQAGGSPIVCPGEGGRRPPGCVSLVSQRVTDGFPNTEDGA